MPREVTLQSLDFWDEDKREYVSRYAVYTIKKLLSKEECEAIDKQREEYYDEQKRKWEEWQEKHNKKEGETA